MYLEEGVQRGITILLIAALIIYLGVILITYFKNKNKGLFWFVLQDLILGLEVYFFNVLIDNPIKVPKAMLTEENTLILTRMVIIFIISLIFMTIGILTILKNEKEKS